jgi:trk system potassium uptake protein TrkH
MFTLDRYIAPLNVIAVATYSLALLQLLGVLLLVPCLVSLMTGEYLYATIFAGMAAGAYLMGFARTFFKRSTLEIKEAIVVTALAYLLFATIGSIAFLPVGPFIDGFFEAMSGFTTTGLSVMESERLPTSLLFFRAYCQWIGGAGIMILSLAVLLTPGRSAFRLFASEYGKENLVGSVTATARVVTVIYLVLTVLGFVVFFFAGMTVREAALYIMATVSTGGFSPHNESAGHYAGPAVLAALCLFMILGAVSFPLYHSARTEGIRRFFQDLQFRWLVGVLAAATLLASRFDLSDPHALLVNFFSFTSALTTTGFELVRTSSLSNGSSLIVVLLMIIGGSAGSTAGGIKLIRLVLFFRLAHWFVLRALLPEETVLPVKYRELVISERELMQVFAFFFVYLSLLFLSALLLVLLGFDIKASLFESASALGTVGLSAGITSPDLAPWGKLLLAFDMWAGRLEVLPLLVLFYPGTWRRWRI